MEAVRTEVRRAFVRRTGMAPCALFALLSVYTLCMVLALLSCTSQPTVQAASRVTFYVSKNGNNSNGLSWQTAWNELDHINWTVVQPGDTIMLDGGASGMTYTTTLTVGKSGQPGEPITISRSAEPGHDGPVTFFGGRSTPLPYCGQSGYIWQTAGVQTQGIDLGDTAYVIIDGGYWHGLTIVGYDGPAVSFGDASQHDTLRNLHVYDDGSASQHSDGTWSPEDGASIVLHGNDHVFQYLDIHDGEEDAFQPIGITNITVQYSWLHDSRSDPAHPAAAFNQCNHNDGMQIWTGHAVSGLVFDHDVFGPEKEEDLILGNGLVKVSNVRVTNSLFISAGAFDIWGSPAENWTIDHITAFAESENLILDGSGHSVTNSIFYGGLIEVNSAYQAHNCQWNTTGNTLSGQTVDPQFISNLSALPLGRSTDLKASPQISTLTNLDFALRATSPCRGLGSPITSIKAFLQQVQVSSPALATPSATSSAMAIPTLPPVVVATSRGGTTSQSTPTATHRPLKLTGAENDTLPLLFLGLAAAVLLVLTLLVYHRLRVSWRKKRP